MITWGKLRADISNLSNSVFYYPLLIGFAWFAYYSVFKSSGDKDLQVAAPLLALFAGSLASIATERQDRVSDRISIEMGGIQARLRVRMLSLLILNSSIVLLGLGVTFLEYGHIGTSSGRTLITSLTVTIIISTLGLLVASYMPHPMVALGITFALMSWGGPDPQSNWGLEQLLGMLRAESLNEWAKFAINFVSPWLLGYFALLAVSNFGPYLGVLGVKRIRLTEKRKAQIPRWLGVKRSFARTVFVGAVTNPLPILALVFCIGLYSYGTINLAAKLAAIAPAADFFALLPGLLFANVIPGLILASTSQRRDAVDQESLLYKSQKQAMTAQTLQQVAFVAITLSGYILVLAKITNVSLSDPLVLRSLLLTLLFSPGFATVGVIINHRIRLPLLSALVSYALTLPEILLARWAPDSRPFLPSSLFSILVGGESSYTRSVEVTSVVVAYILGACIVALPVFSFFSRKQDA